MSLKGKDAYLLYVTAFLTKSDTVKILIIFKLPYF